MALTSSVRKLHCIPLRAFCFSSLASDTAVAKPSRIGQSTLSVGFDWSSSPASVASEIAIKEGPRHDWERAEIQSIYDSPLLDLLFHGPQVHRHAHKFREVQQCTLLSIKTGGCSEDCAYGPQSARYNTQVKAQKLLNSDIVLETARKAKEAGSSRVCMGAAWRDTVGRKTNFQQVLNYVKEIRAMDMEVCCTLGMLEKQQAEEAGLTAYNHNLDTSREFYPNVITTRSYDERLKTLELVREAGISVCSDNAGGKVLGSVGQDLRPFCNSDMVRSPIWKLPCNYGLSQLQQRRSFVQLKTRLNVADNTGAKIVECIKVLNKTRGARLGDKIIASVKEAIGRGKVKKGQIVRCVIVRARMPRSRSDGSEVRFDDNAVVLINEEGEPLGTRINGPVSHELRHKKMVKVLSLAEHVA